MSELEVDWGGDPEREVDFGDAEDFIIASSSPSEFSQWLASAGGGDRSMGPV
jgi:hypothetical protein